MIWFLKSKWESERERRWAVRALNEQSVELAALRVQVARLEDATRCTGWTEHLRMAHEVEQLQVRLAEERGIDPHKASRA